jgi:hypothetical protein
MRRGDIKVCGYPVPSGYMGWVVNRFMLFATEQDYLDLVDWYEHEDD